MQFSRFVIVRSFVVLALACMVAVSVQAQVPDGPTPQTNPAQPAPKKIDLIDYSKPKSHFPNPIAPYTAREVPENNNANPARLQSLVRDGKIMLSMNDAVALALENNLDIAIARFNLNIADTDVLRANSGAPLLGTNFGVVQGTPGGLGYGGSLGSGVGGTSTAGTGGAGAGLNGIVSSTLGSGPQITSFDPVLSGTIQFDHSKAIANSAFSGVPFVLANQQNYSFNYLQGFQTGTNLSVGFNNFRNTTNSPFTTLSPQLNSNFNARITQHLLQGFGFAPNRRFIRIAKNNRQIADVTFRLQVISTVNQIEYMYWDLVNAYENVRVQKESIAFAQKTLDDTKKQVQIGTLAPIEIVRAQSTVATDQQSLIQAETNLQLQQLYMKNALSRNLQDPGIADAEVVPTSTMSLPAQEAAAPIQDLINQALSRRPEILTARINMNNNEISKKAIRSSLRPTLDAFAYYGGSGLGGIQNPGYICSGPSAPAGFCDNFQPTPGVSYGGTLNQLIDSTAPDKGIGLTLNIPIRNRAAQAEQVRSELEYRQAQLYVQQLENTIRIQVRNAQFAVQQSRAGVESAQAAADFAHQSLDAEQKKYALGASTATLVLQNQSALATAQSNLVTATANYVKARLDLDRATGNSLENAGVLVSDAQQADVTHMPSLPYIMPRQDAEPNTVQPDTTQPAPAPVPQDTPLTQ